MNSLVSRQGETSWKPLQTGIQEAERLAQYREALGQLGASLELERTPLDDLFSRVTGFYSSVESWIRRTGYKLIAGGGAGRKVRIDTTARRLFSALFLRVDDRVPLQQELHLILGPLTQLRDLSLLLIGKREGRQKRDLLVFHEHIETFIRALMMAKLHQLDIFISY